MPNIFHLEDMIDVDSFIIRSVLEIIQELLQVKGFFVEHLNNFNIIVDIKNFTELLKSKDIFLLVQNLKAVKCAVIVIICVALDIEIQSICPK